MKPRVKFRQMPGDVPKRVKIAMVEDRVIEGLPDFYAGSMTPGARKSFRKMLKMRERAVLKRQAETEIKREE